MNFYYTTSAGYNQPQPNSSKSLGGYKSSSQVRNDDLGNIFNNVTLYTLYSAKSNYSCVILKNILPTNVTNLQIWLDQDAGNQCAVSVGVATLIPDTNGNGYTQRVADIYSAPIGINFFNYTETNKGLIGNFQAGEEIAIWFKRTIDKTKAKQSYDNVYQLIPGSSRMYEKTDRPTSETISLNLSWD